MKIKKTKRVSKKTIIILSSVAVAVLTLAGGFLVWKQNSSTVSSPAESSDQTTTDTNPIPEDPEAKQEEKSVEESPKPSTDGGSTPSNPGSGLAAVTPVIIEASQSGATAEVRAFIPNLVEEGGACMVTLTHAEHKITKQTAGHADATTTRCDTFSIARSEFAAAGKWKVTVSYKSAKAQGTSAEKEMEVQ